MSQPQRGRVTPRLRRIVTFVARSERHRLGVVFGVSVLFSLLVIGAVGQNLGPLPFVLIGVLVLFLYTRASARATVTASATGPGALCLGLFLFQVSRTIAGASTEPVAATLRRNAPWLVAGLVLLGVGAWLRRNAS